MKVHELNRLLGNVDIYLLDQILKDRFKVEMKILDAGCGEGRNAIYFINAGYQIFGIDQDELTVQYIRFLSKSLNPNYDFLRFQQGKLQDIPFHSGAFDAVICSAVLHFASSEADFWQMLGEIHRVLKPGGIFWFRMTTGSGGILESSTSIGDGRFLLPDGSERFLMTESHLDLLQDSGWEYLEPPKSVLVHGQRAMGVFLMQKSP